MASKFQLVLNLQSFTDTLKNLQIFKYKLRNYDRMEFRYFLWGMAFTFSVMAMIVFLLGMTADTSFSFYQSANESNSYASFYPNAGFYLQLTAFAMLFLVLFFCTSRFLSERPSLPTTIEFRTEPVQVTSTNPNSATNSVIYHPTPVHGSFDVENAIKHI